ncbi:predicted protein [Lichtheimia corymbifera JMRC:FSU:9682]|uniref:Uncharacterized protein n=1 Tax=Lichtheimia corymbifera JMRC:FSU:9682 TaxID=1263082 RepID=A0A068RY90_9FUNG|nr:predicted protein [Lichtheimia corymbifera JMRC:FSU:9682]
MTLEGYRWQKNSWTQGPSKSKYVSSNFLGLCFTMLISMTKSNTLMRVGWMQSWNESAATVTYGPPPCPENVCHYTTRRHLISHLLSVYCILHARTT